MDNRHIAYITFTLNPQKPAYLQILSSAIYTIYIPINLFFACSTLFRAGSRKAKRFSNPIDVH